MMLVPYWHIFSIVVIKSLSVTNDGLLGVCAHHLLAM